MRYSDSNNNTRISRHQREALKIEKGKTEQNFPKSKKDYSPQKG